MTVGQEKKILFLHKESDLSKEFNIFVQATAELNEHKLLTLWAELDLVSDDDNRTNRTSLGRLERLVPEQQGAAEDSLRIMMSHYFWSGRVLVGRRVNFWQGCWETKWPLRSELLRRQTCPVVSLGGKINLMQPGWPTRCFEPSGFFLHLIICYISVLSSNFTHGTYF